MAVTEETMLKLFENFNSALESKLEKIEQSTIESINKNIDEKFETYQEEINLLKQENESQNKRLNLIEKQIRQRNLVLFGIAEEEKSYFELENIVLDIINIQLNIKCNKSELEFVRRIGKKSNKPRPICFGLTTLGMKIQILKEKNKLEKTGAYIKEDYAPRILEIRKSLQEKLKEEKEKGHRATIKYDKIVILKDPIPEKKKEETNKRPFEHSPPNTSLKPPQKPNLSFSRNQPVKKNKTGDSGSPIPKYHTS